MVQFIFRGNNADGFVNIGGVRFEKDTAQDISDEAWIAKLDANGEFERAGAGPTEASPPPFGGPAPGPEVPPDDGEEPEGATDEGPKRGKRGRVEGA
jgi:hypothetical protein